MKAGYVIRLQEYELNTLITACSVRRREISELIRAAQDTGAGSHAGREYLRKQYDNLNAVIDILENADFCIDIGEDETK